MRDRLSEGVDRAGNSMSDLRDRTKDFYGHEEHTIRNVVSFVAGVGVGVGIAMLCAPASGEVIRGSIGEKARAVGDRVRDRFAHRVSPSATGTDGVREL
jgi:hypothetical protein